MRNLTSTEISKLTTRKGVKAVAVENFLTSLKGLNELQALGNLAQDAHSYKWNAPTVAAITKGIRMAFMEGESEAQSEARQNAIKEYERKL